MALHADDFRFKPKPARPRLFRLDAGRAAQVKRDHGVWRTMLNRDIGAGSAAMITTDCRVGNRVPARGVVVVLAIAAGDQGLGALDRTDWIVYPILGMTFGAAAAIGLLRKG